MELKQLNLIEIVNDYGVSLERRGKEYWTSCPFHEDMNPSFSISPVENGHVWYFLLQEWWWCCGLRI